ncbi:MAG: pyridoxamine 5'-phosphate oxidase family protein [Acidimicrobiales bacterium]
MGRSFDAVPPELADFVVAQPVFFVATAPLGRNDHVNVSPKGGDTLRVLDEATVAYLDLTGSGVETIAHLRDNGRITLMWCAFEGPPQIVRVYGRGDAVLAAEPRFSALADRFPSLAGVRSVIVVHVERVSTSCGFGVPVMRLQQPRHELQRWAERKGPAGVAGYQAKRNAVSIDGLPGLVPPAQAPAATARSKAARAPSS